jgi:hypothetical protein
LTLKYLWSTKESGCEFQLFKDNEELFFKYKDNLVGGPSIIFNHYQEKDVTRIRQSEQLAKRQDHERKNLEHSQDEQRKNTLLQEYQRIDQTRNGLIQAMEQLDHVSAMLFRQIVGFASQLPDREDE